jgi:hypothetical protein
MRLELINYVINIKAKLELLDCVTQRGRWERGGIIIMISISILFFNCKKYDEFEEVNLNNLDVSFEHYQLNQAELIDTLFQQGYTVNLGKFNDGPFIEKQRDNTIIEFEEIIRIAEISSDTLIITSGIRGIESGFKYFLGTYSEIFILNKANLSILNKFTIDEIVTNARVINNSIYLWYGSSENFKLGKIRLK